MQHGGKTDKQAEYNSCNPEILFQFGSIEEIMAD